MPQFRCNTEFAVQEFKHLFDVEEIRQLNHSDQNMKELSYNKTGSEISYNDQYLIVLRKKVKTFSIHLLITQIHFYLAFPVNSY